jgi:hypothetical protein
MSDLAVNRVDPAEAAERVRADVKEALPSAGVDVRTLGDPEQPSMRQALRQGFVALTRSQGALFAVVADCNAPRPVRIQVRYVGIGRGAGPTSIVYLARLRHVVPGGAAFKSGRLGNGSFEGHPAVAAALSGTPRLGSAVSKLLQPTTVYGSMYFTIKPAAELLPDDDGAILAVFSAPGRRRMGLGGKRLDLAAFLDVASGIEGALATVPDVTPAATLNAPLPD